MRNIFSIDVEEYFHDIYAWDTSSNSRRNLNYRTPKNIEHVLNLLDEYDIKATFFMVGEIAEKFPHVIERICGKGHELAFHGYHHKPLWKSNSEELKSDIMKFNSLMNKKCLGFRAPWFSLNNRTKWALEVLENANFIYDSSIFPTKTPLYGVWEAPVNPYRPSYEDVTRENENGKLLEFPLFVYSLFGLKIPMAGGFYLRFFPISMIERAVKRANEHGTPAVIYIHNWELDPETSKLKPRSFVSPMIYYNVKGTERRVRHLLNHFRFISFQDYIKEHGLWNGNCARAKLSRKK